MKKFDNFEIYLDSIDKKIIYMLTEDEKSTHVVISKNVGISTVTVHQRIKKMEIAGVINNSVSILNPKRIGYKISSYVGICLDYPKQYTEVVNSLQDINEVVEAHFTAGSYTLFLKVLCKDNDHLLQLLKNLMKIKGVAKIETFISLEQGIDRQLKVL
ncbi:Lrp/AsnC ligand binding domain-containing protein [Chryseobacterium sp. Bi04]|uniref:Lrp/AsnC family transcriptional regulator n=1 Tax=Chryseobacterium sp. Bi04 TaxID=2822345 RepID=UPI001D85E343|nr:Lrp/AsnC ligand binding domain-containing protein [Chryseobacterium sp. Bi04]CAH0193558.1 Regulatory protein AsnC [Chryseobacterium sp. Bi04]